jgi:DNA-binding CsgD family transcriptional regulator
MDMRQRENIASHLRDGKSYSQIQRLLKCGRDTIAAVKKEMQDVA